VAAYTRLERPDQLVSLLFTQPFSTFKHLTSTKLYVENTARKYLNQLTDLSELDKRTIAGHHYYLNLELHRIWGE
jgi:hypothetical protein